MSATVACRRVAVTGTQGNVLAGTPNSFASPTTNQHPDFLACSDLFAPRRVWHLFCAQCYRGASLYGAILRYHKVAR